LVFVSTWQQFNNIKNLTDFQVEEYYGAKGVDTWTLKTWEKEISTNDVCLFINPIVDFTKILYTSFFMVDYTLGLMTFNL